MPRCPFCDCLNEADARKCASCGGELSTFSDDLNAAAPPSNLPNDIEQQVLALLGGRNKIAAIKLYRELSGCGLKEAKDAVEALERKHGITSSGAGCAGMLMLCLVVALSLVWTLC